MGIKGAALATVISQTANTIWVLRYFTGNKSSLKLKLVNFKLNKKIFIGIVSIGMSPFCMQLAASVVNVISNNALKTYGGDLAIGAMTVINSTCLVFLMPIFGINQGSQPLIGYNYGAKKYTRVKDTVKYAIFAASVISLLGFIAVQAFPEAIINMFNKDSALIEVGSKGIRIFLAMLPVVGFQIISSNYFEAIGKAKISAFLSLLRQVILLIPLLLILPKYLGLIGIWLAGPISDGLSALITGFFLVKDIRRLNNNNKITKEQCA